MDFLGIGPLELLLILLLAFLVFGPGKLPEIARGVGKFVREFKKYSMSLTNDLKNEIEKEVNTPSGMRRENTEKAKGTFGERKAALTQAEGIQAQGADERTDLSRTPDSKVTHNVEGDITTP